MTKNNSIQQFSLWGNVIKFGKKLITIFRTNLREFSIKYPNSSQIIQLSFIYLFALIDLFHSILNNVFAFL